MNLVREKQKYTLSLLDSQESNISSLLGNGDLSGGTTQRPRHYFPN